MESVKKPQAAQVHQFKHHQFLVVCKFHDPKELSISITDTANFLIYEVQNYKIKSLLCETIKAALENKDPKNISAKITQSTPGSDEGSVTLNFSVHYEFIPEIEESINIPQKKDVNEDEIIKVQLMLRQKEIEDLSKQVEKLKKGMITNNVSRVENKSFAGQNEEVCKLKLAKGSYIVTIALFQKSASNMIYFKLEVEGKDVLNIPNGGYYFYNAGANSYYNPHTIRAIVKINKDEGEEVKLTTQNCQSYPWTCHNLIMSAASFEDEEEEKENKKIMK